jgi:hypothetical protein
MGCFSSKDVKKSNVHNLQDFYNHFNNLQVQFQNIHFPDDENASDSDDDQDIEVEQQVEVQLVYHPELNPFVPAIAG